MRLYPVENDKHKHLITNIDKRLISTQILFFTCDILDLNHHEGELHLDGHHVILEKYEKSWSRYTKTQY